MPFPVVKKEAAHGTLFDIRIQPTGITDNQQ
jgi:hypothetical protein